MKERAHAVVAAHPPDRRAQRAIGDAVDAAAALLTRRQLQGAGVIGVALVRDEVDLIATTLEQVLVEGVDADLVFDHGSVDGTTEVITEPARSAEMICGPTRRGRGADALGIVARRD